MKPEVLDKLHWMQLDMMDRIDQVCRRHGFVYFLDGGSMLGAIRHKGFIPWDDDIDILMPRSDYEKFIRLSEEEIGQNYFIQSYRNDVKHNRPFAKLRRKNTVYIENDKAARMYQGDSGIFIDIFPLDNVNGYGIFPKIQKFLTNKITVMLIIKPGAEDIGYMKRLFCKLFSSSFLLTLQQTIMRANRNEESLYWGSFGTHYDIVRKTFLKAKMLPPIRVPFEGRTYNVPNDWDYALNVIFGKDYMDMPPVEKRVCHDIVRLSFDTNGPDEKLNG